MAAEVAWKVACRVGRATFTTEPSMNASDEPRMIAMRIHLRSGGVQGTVAEASATWAHGGTRCDLAMAAAGPVTVRLVTFHGCARGHTMCTEFLQVDRSLVRAPGTRAAFPTASREGRRNLLLQTST